MSSHEDTAALVAGARPDDPAGLVLARARVEGALFGSATGLARFHVLERLGRGGMGVVYAAYDPELDRGVALKMIHVPARGRELALAEAKALARLSHPNVVPVFDVGVVEDHVYIVMELVRGVTLRGWVEGRPARAIVEVYLQAAAALAAAHAAGLVHRDFKPDNAIVGSDGRVRVVDFGLACEASPADGAADDPGAAPARIGGGTPRYMAPEQEAGSVTPAADQYSFCVSLDEALRAGGAEPPRWVEAVIERGRARDPAARFASMAELARALGRDPRRLWRMRIAVAALAAATAVAFLAGRSRAADEPEPCSGGAAELAAVWPRSARDTQLARIAGLDGLGAELAPRLADRLDEHAARWTAGHRGACLAHRRGEQSAVQLDRRMACLARSRAALGAVAELVAAADARTLPDVARAATALPDPAACADTDALATDVEPPPAAIAPRITQLRAELERARLQLIAGHTTAARDAARAAAGELRTFGYGPLLAEALLLEGRAQMRTDRDAARAALTGALQTGIAAHRDAIAIEAWARRAFVDSWGAHLDTALAGLDLVEPLAGRTRSATFARALLRNSIGAVERRHGRRAEARAAFAEAMKLSEGVRGEDAVELYVARNNLAHVTEDPRVRDQLTAGVVRELSAALGDSHPEVLKARYLRGGTVLRLADARELFAEACERAPAPEAFRAYLPSCFLELGVVRDELGDRAGAIAAYDRVVAELLRARDDAAARDTREVAGYLALWRGDPAAALRAFEAAIAASPRDPRDEYAELVHGKQQLGYGRALRAAGRLADARAALEAALAAFAAIGPASPTTEQRRLTRARAELAEVLAATGGPRDRIRALAEQALAGYAGADAPDDRYRALRALTTGSP